MDGVAGARRTRQQLRRHRVGKLAQLGGKGGQSCRCKCHRTGALLLTNLTSRTNGKHPTQARRRQNRIDGCNLDWNRNDPRHMHPHSEGERDGLQPHRQVMEHQHLPLTKSASEMPYADRMPENRCTNTSDMPSALAMAHAC